jgi:hypothetical protein
MGFSGLRYLDGFVFIFGYVSSAAFDGFIQHPQTASPTNDCQLDSPAAMDWAT